MKTYIHVPPHAAHRAKALGARFDMARKQWFVPDGLDLASFAEWVPDSLRPWLGRLPVDRVREAQEAAMNFGLAPDMDGRTAPEGAVSAVYGSCGFLGAAVTGHVSSGVAGGVVYGQQRVGGDVGRMRDSRPGWAARVGATMYSDEVFKRLKRNSKHCVSHRWPRLPSSWAARRRAVHEAVKALRKSGRVVERIGLRLWRIDREVMSTSKMVVVAKPEFVAAVKAMRARARRQAQGRVALIDG